MASSSSSAAVAGQDLYDFDAPQFYDFGGETEERENDPPPAVVAGGVAAAAASMDNKQPQSQQQQQPDAGTVASLVKGMGSMSLPSPAVPGTIPSSEPQQQQEEQAPKGPWDFDAPMWSDLGQPAAYSQQQQAQQQAAAPPVPSSTTGSSSRATPTRGVVGSPKPRQGMPVTAATARRSNSPTTGALQRRAAPSSPTAAAQAAAVRKGSPHSPGDRAAGAATTRKVGVATVTAPMAAAVSSSSSAAAATSTAAATYSRSRNLLAPTASSAARTFVNRPRKEPAPAAAAPVQHHSYLSHTAAKKVNGRTAPTQPVHAMASFLRPTAASWGRTQKEQQEAATAAPSSSSRVASKFRAAGGPVRAFGTTGRKPVVGGVGGGGGGRVVESTEERELRLAREAQEQLRKRVEKNRLNVERNRYVGSSSAAAPLRSTKALTIPQSPHLRLNDRHGEKHVSCRSLPSPTDCEVEETVPGVQLFYKPRAPTPTGPRALTVPVAPKLHTDSRAGRKPPSPRGPQEEGFQPEQSHHKGPAGGLALREYLAPSAPVPAPKPPSPRGLTVPQSPHLSTGQRAAARRPLQQAAQAAVEAAVAVAAQFKARPVDHRVLHSNGEMGVPKVAKHEATQPQPFHFQTDARLRGHSQQQQEREGEQERQARNNVVRARPLPASTFQRTFELKPSEHAPVLAEAAPRLATETRAEQRAEYEERVREREAAKRRAEAAKEAERRKALEAEERRLRATPVGEGGHQFTARPVGYQGQGGVRVRQGARVEKVLTVPISPMLQTKARAHVRVVPSAASAPPQG